MKRRAIFGIVSIMLALSLVMVGCDNGLGDDMMGADIEARNANGNNGNGNNGNNGNGNNGNNGNGNNGNNGNGNNGNNGNGNGDNARFPATMGDVIQREVGFNHDFVLRTRVWPVDEKGKEWFSNMGNGPNGAGTHFANNMPELEYIGETELGKHTWKLLSDKYFCPTCGSNEWLSYSNQDGATPMAGDTVQLVCVGHGELATIDVAAIIGKSFVMEEYQVKYEWNIINRRHEYFGESSVTRVAVTNAQNLTMNNGQTFFPAVDGAKYQIGHSNANFGNNPRPQTDTGYYFEVERRGSEWWLVFEERIKGVTVSAIGRAAAPGNESVSGHTQAVLNPTTGRMEVRVSAGRSNNINQHDVNNPWLLNDGFIRVHISAYNTNVRTACDYVNTVAASEYCEDNPHFRRYEGDIKVAIFDADGELVGYALENNGSFYVAELEAGTYNIAIYILVGENGMERMFTYPNNPIILGEGKTYFAKDVTYFYDNGFVDVRTRDDVTVCDCLHDCPDC